MNADHVDAMRETAKHIRRVQHLMNEAMVALLVRAAEHDASKWSSEEWPYFAEATSRLRGLTYGSAEYRDSLDSIRPGVEHHTHTNSHHPECHARGIVGMSLLDLLEMLADWKAAGERHADGSLTKSLTHNAERFEIPDALAAVLRNTAVELGWLDE